MIFQYSSAEIFINFTLNFPTEAYKPPLNSYKDSYASHGPMCTRAQKTSEIHVEKFFFFYFEKNKKIQYIQLFI